MAKLVKTARLAGVLVALLAERRMISTLQGWGRGFESLRPLQISLKRINSASWRSSACKPFGKC
jgi:hypothetical protein